jgi:hypothetical protein
MARVNITEDQGYCLAKDSLRSYTVRNGLTEKFQTWKSPESARESFVAEKVINFN